MSSIPDRVRSLMAKSGLSLHDFAEHVDLDAAQLSASLSGASAFSVVDLACIADACEISMDWLLTGSETPLAVAARTTTGDAAEALEAAREYTSRRTDLDTLGYPQPWRPVTATARPGASYAARGEALARAALKETARQGRSAIAGNLGELIEETFGADVAVVQLGDGFDGLAATARGTKLILLAATSNPARQRFTLAHELGHLLAGDNQEVHLDRDIFSPAQKKDPSEQRANAFASAFLMPEEILREAITSVGLTRASYAALACDLMVSPEALAYRLLYLRLIDAGTCDRYKRMTASEAAQLAGRSEEFEQRAVLSQKPRLPGLLVRDTRAAYEAGKSTVRPYATLLGVDADELKNELDERRRDNGGAA
ncbi:XRE family transcriptional regulator [Streptomyces stramineus]|uniref:helix-turn-helix domain-containing protein n=1 Tax=Streptomyces TaxID=1883 RepID=UPI0031DA74DD